MSWVRSALTHSCLILIRCPEHYFEMSAVDAEQSLTIYKSFCTQTEGVVEYLSIARKLSNLLNVPVPNLRHARISSLSRFQLADSKI
jgi:phosphatidylinositol-binding clathrin assembly protein